MSRFTVLDVCCGGRSFWFDPDFSGAVFQDNRNESHILVDASSMGGTREVHIWPQVKSDFTALPYKNETFALIVFDPPHLLWAGRTGWLAKKYGKLTTNWREDIRKGFSECFRVLKPFGTLVFKWNETDISLNRILELTENKPLFGNRCGKTAKSHWLVFHKWCKP